MRPAHKLHGISDMPPGLGQFNIALHFEGNGVLGGFRNGLGAVGLKQLPRIIVDFDFPHGATLLLFRARSLSPTGTRTLDVNTYQARTACTLTRDVCKSPFGVTGCQ